MQVIRSGEGNLFGSFCVDARHRFRYITISLEYIYQGSGRAELYPNAVVLVCFDPSPLYGLASSPTFLFDEDTQQAVKLDEHPLNLSIEAGSLHHAALVYEVHQDCREFRLYFPGLEGIPVTLVHA